MKRWLLALTPCLALLATPAQAAVVIDAPATTPTVVDVLATSPVVIVGPSSVSAPSALKVETLRQAPAGAPTAALGQSVSVHYVGRFLDGREFDASRGRGPFTFTLGEGQVIRGWEQGVAGMKVGEVRRLTIPPTLAYGPRGVGGVIPPNATLVFEVELLSIR